MVAMAQKKAQLALPPVPQAESTDIVKKDDAVIVYLREQDRVMSSHEKRDSLAQLIRAGMPVDRAAAMIHIKPATAWRIIASDSDVADALHEGERVRASRIQHTVVARAHDMLNVISDVAQDADQNGKTRIDAAKMWLDMTGMFAGPTSGSGAAAIVEVDTGGSDFADRLQRITIKAGTRS